jgi:hypothetical protein
VDTRDVSGGVAVYAPDRAVLADSNPELLTDMDHVTEAARTAGYKGRLKIVFTIGTDGVPRAISILSPASLINDPGVISAVQALRYRPQIKNGAAVAVAMNLELGVSWLPADLCDRQTVHVTVRTFDPLDKTGSQPLNARQPGASELKASANFPPTF